MVRATMNETILTVQECTVCRACNMQVITSWKYGSLLSSLVFVCLPNPSGDHESELKLQLASQDSSVLAKPCEASLSPVRPVPCCLIEGSMPSM